MSFLLSMFGDFHCVFVLISSLLYIKWRDGTLFNRCVFRWCYLLLRFWYLRLLLIWVTRNSSISNRWRFGWVRLIFWVNSLLEIISFLLILSIFILLSWVPWLSLLSRIIWNLTLKSIASSVARFTILTFLFDRLIFILSLQCHFTQRTSTFTYSIICAIFVFNEPWTLLMRWNWAWWPTISPQKLLILGNWSS